MRRWCAPTLIGALVTTTLVFGVTGAPGASAAGSPVALGTATSFPVLAGSTVTDTGASVISGDLGLSPETSVTGFPPGTVTNGDIHAADVTAAQAQLDLTSGYGAAEAQTPTSTAPGDVG